jgi:hypothetical protein
MCLIFGLRQFRFWFKFQARGRGVVRLHHYASMDCESWCGQLVNSSDQASKLNGKREMPQLATIADVNRATAVIILKEHKTAGKP